MSLTQPQKKSIELLQSGMAQKDVAQELGVTPKTLQRWAKIPEYADKLNGIAQDTPKQATQTENHKTINDMVSLGDRERLRNEQYQKLQIAQNALMDEVQAGNVRAVAVFVKLSESIRALFGLNIKHDILEAFEVLVKAKILPYEYVSKFDQYSYEYEQKIKRIGSEPPKPISKQFKTVEEELDYWLAKLQN